MQAQGHARGRAGVQAHAEVHRPGGPAERRPEGVQLGSLAKWAAMQQRFMVRSTRCPSCGQSLGVSPLCRSSKSLHRRPTVGDLSVRFGDLTR
jgi:hypothetical protein